MAIGALFFAALFCFWIWCLFDVIVTNGELVRNLPKIAWVVIVVLLGAIGGLAWVLLGRPQSGVTRSRPAQSWTARRPAPAPVDEGPRHRERPEISDRRSAELDRVLERWEREQQEQANGGEPGRDEG